MPKYIIKHVMPDGSKRYLTWSTIVDAPLTFGGSLEQLFETWQDWYGRFGVAVLKRDLERKGFDKLEDVIACNRAGKNETRLTREQIVDFYFEGDRATGDEPPMGTPNHVVDNQ